VTSGAVGGIGFALPASGCTHARKGSDGIPRLPSPCPGRRPLASRRFGRGSNSERRAATTPVDVIRNDAPDESRCHPGSPISCGSARRGILGGVTFRNRRRLRTPRSAPPLRAASALVGSSAPLICVFLLAAGPDALVGGLPGGGTGAAGRASGVAWLPSDVVPEVGHSGCLDHVRLLKRAPSQRRAIEEPDAGLQERRGPGGYPAHRAGRRPGTAGRCCRRRTRPRSFRPPRGEPVPGQLPGRRSRT
jgi:hypothetical protein